MTIYTVRSGGQSFEFEAESPFEAAKLAAQSKKFKNLSVIMEVQPEPVYVSTERVCKAVGMWGG